MAEKHCPICGSSNTEAATNCQFCGAPFGDLPARSEPDDTPDWLKDFQSEDSGAAEPEPAAPAESGLPDWLSSIRQRSAAEETPGVGGLLGAEEEESGAVKADLPDWLSNLRPSEAETPVPAASEAEPEEDDTAWLKGLGDWQSGPLGGDSSAQAAEPAGDDWLRNLGGGLGETPAEPPVPAQPASSQDWLGDLRGLSAERAAAPAEESAPLEGLPSWLEDSSAPQTPAASGDNFQDWLADVPEELPAQPSSTSGAGLGDLPDWMQTPAAAEETPAAAGNEPDWLNAFAADSSVQETPAEVSPAASDETPDWLSAFAAEAPAEETPTAAGDTPDWLNAFAADSSAQETPAAAGDTPNWLNAFAAESPTEETPAASDEAPDWLNAFAADAPAVQGEAPAEETPAAADDTPDWLSAFAAEAPALQGDAPAQETPAAADDTPDWLSAFAAEAPALQGEAPAQEIPAQEAPAAAVDGTPDWLKEFAADFSAQETPDAAPQAPASQGEAPAFQGEAPVSQDGTRLFQDETRAFDLPESQPPAGETADWLRAFASEDSTVFTSPTDTTPSSGEPVPAFALGDGADLPDWLSEVDLTEMNLENDTSGDAALASADQVPDWLRDKASQAGVELSSEAEAETEAAAVPAGELAPAALPAWLQAMRPVEAVMQTGAEGALVESDRVEKAGPLAGIQGILPTLDLTRQYRKPPRYSSKLKTSEKQREHAELLDALVSGESQPQQVQREFVQAPQRVMRIGIGLLLILVVVLTYLFGSVPANPAAPVEVLHFNNAVGGLPPGSTVLLAVDYAPAYSGEMRLAATRVVQLLMEKGLRLALVSTQVTGPVLGADLLRSAAAELPAGSFNFDEQSANLGYLPGGIASLREFANQPRRAVRWPGMWDLPAVQQVNALTDFSAIIVLTDQVEGGRAWMEQVQPLYGESPFLLVSSAQAAPVLQAYVNDGQADGLVAGFTGGMAFAGLSGQTPAGLGGWWGSYRAGLFLAVVLIFLGVILQALIRLSTRRKA